MNGRRRSLVFSSSDLPPSAPKEFRIWKRGDNPTDKGVHKLTEESIAAILGHQADRQNRIAIDVDHLSLEPDAPPGHRRAVGWHSLEARNGELWAVDVEWTDEVRSGLECSPPAWKFFSPAYSVDPKTGEIVGYVNLALTNNPATWALNALASTCSEPTSKGSRMLTMADIKAALKAMAEGEDGDEKKEAAAMLAAFDGEDEPKKGDEKKEEASEDEEPPKKDESASVVASLSAVVQSLSTKVESLEKRNEIEERDRLLASRKDLAPELVSVLRDAPIATVRAAVSKLKIAEKKDHAAAEKVQATIGAGQNSEKTTALPKEESDALRARMGLGDARASIRREGNTLVLAAMNPEQAKAFLSERAKEGAK